MFAIRWQFLLFVLPLPFITGCGREALKFNNAAAKTTKDLENIGHEFGVAIGQNRGNAAKLKEVHEKIKKDMNRVLAEGRALTVPNSAQAKDFHKAFLEYLSAEEKIFNEDFAQAVSHLSQNNVQAFQAQLNSIQQYEAPFVQRMKDAQAKFAKANNFIVQ